MKYVLAFAAAFILGMTGDASTASTDFRQAPVEALYSEGMRLFEAEDLDAALLKFRKALGINKKHAPSLVGAGHVYLKHDDLDAAEDAFMDARRRKRKFAPAHNGLGLVYMRKEKGLQWAIRYFQNAISVDRTYAEAYYNLAEAYRRIGDTKELMAYKRLSKIAPEHWDVLVSYRPHLQERRSGTICPERSGGRLPFGGNSRSTRITRKHGWVWGKS